MVFDPLLLLGIFLVLVAEIAMCEQPFCTILCVFPFDRTVQISPYLMTICPFDHELGRVSAPMTKRGPRTAQPPHTKCTYI